MKVYILMVSDRHSDVDVLVYADKDKAIQDAKEMAIEYCRFPEDLEEEKIDGWLYYCRYSCESDNVRVEEKEIII